jgi:hypothetical protein
VRTDFSCVDPNTLLYSPVRYACGSEAIREGTDDPIVLERYGRAALESRQLLEAMTARVALIGEHVEPQRDRGPAGELQRHAAAWLKVGLGDPRVTFRSGILGHVVVSHELLLKA